MRHLPLALSLPLCVACAVTPERSPALRASDSSHPALQQHSAIRDSAGPGRESGLPWAESQPLMHGFIGASSYSKVEVDSGVDGDDGDLDQLPLIGGGAQWKLGGKGLDLGLEGLLCFSGRANAEAIAVGGGGAVVVLDVDLLLFELYGGPFASVFLGDKLRLYGAAGPLMQFADYQQTGGGLADDGSGFGLGWYARTGLEFVLASRTLIGFGARWSDSTIDLDGGLGDLEVEGLQLLFTVSRGL